MITLRCKLEPEDYIQAQYLHMRSRFSLKNIFIFVLIISLITFALSVSVYGLTLALAKTETNFIFVILLGFVYAFTYFITIPRKARRTFLQQKALHMEYEILISPEMIETISERGTVRIPLSDFYKYKVGKDLILLYQSQVVFNMFPHRFFASEEDFKTFLFYLDANLGRPKR